MKAIVAVDENMGIGLNNDLPWPKIKEDFKWFKEFTLDQSIIVGNTTFKTLPRLYKRHVYVLHRRISPRACNGIYVGGDKWYGEYHVERSNIVDWGIVCGGAQIYQLLIPECEELYVTHVAGTYGADTYFPFTMEEIHAMFPRNEVVRLFEGGHKVVKYYK